jgi:hypothetical protein
MIFHQAIREEVENRSKVEKKGAEKILVISVLEKNIFAVVPSIVDVVIHPMLDWWKAMHVLPRKTSQV